MDVCTQRPFHIYRSLDQALPGGTHWWNAAKMMAFD